ncbi:MAG: succinate dehydrogenase, hydrophobic membrane anchor protein [Gammaproteobacteria bacterium]|nr:succinate dehydrogenase, hydrophobic membrane anchor protein [Gammaproteobacteria bacterium]
MALVTNVTSLTRSGLADFLIQRITAVVLALYTLCVLGFLLVTDNLSHAALVDYFGSMGMRLFSTMAVLSTAAHAWIGMWTVGTDYIRPHYFGTGATVFRFVYQSGCVLILFVYVAWALQLFWSL